MPSSATRPAPRRPRDIIADLAAQLRALGVTVGMYAAADLDRAVLSLPQLTIWATGRSLYPTHQGKLVTWPAGDTGTATRHVAQPPATPPTA